ncbi:MULTISPECIES: hypothetical protein [unclassified Ekhidna]|jgi:hypothetical protein|uniref:hypothetical protein n=1 Tax=unclassified Ekhidna TaxID=2632188 RepID=UPI0032DF1D39
MLKLLVILGSSVILSACIIQNHPITYKYIRFGNGGGFTGEIEGYKLVNNELYRLNSPEVLRVIPDNELNIINTKLSSLDSLRYNHPANMYRFIKIEYQNNTSVEYQWGINEEPPNELKRFFDILMEATNH